MKVTRHKMHGLDRAPVHEVTVYEVYHELRGLPEVTLEGIVLKAGTDLQIFGSDSLEDEVVYATVKLADPDELITVAKVN